MNQDLIALLARQRIADYRREADDYRRAARRRTEQPAREDETGPRAWVRRLSRIAPAT